MEQTQENQQDYILYGKTAEGTEKHSTGKLKRVRG